MGIYLNPGNEGFQRAVQSRIYVDKTGLIDYTNSVLGTEQDCICISRPRRVWENHGSGYADSILQPGMRFQSPVFPIANIAEARF